MTLDLDRLWAVQRLCLLQAHVYVTQVVVKEKREVHRNVEQSREQRSNARTREATTFDGCARFLFPPFHHLQSNTSRQTHTYHGNKHAHLCTAPALWRRHHSRDSNVLPRRKVIASSSHCTTLSSTDTCPVYTATYVKCRTRKKCTSHETSMTSLSSSRSWRASRRRKLRRISRRQ